MIENIFITNFKSAGNLAFPLSKFNCFIGMNATIAHGVTIGEKNIIGAGALITKSTREGSVYVRENSKALPMDSKAFARFL